MSLLKCINIFFFFFLLAVDTYSQVDIGLLLKTAIRQDSTIYYSEMQNSKGTLLYLEDKIFLSPEKNVREYLADINLEIIDVLAFPRLRKHQKKKYPIIYIDQVQFESDLILFKVNGVRFLYRKKRKDYFQAFSELLVAYKFNCETKNWELDEITDISRCYISKKADKQY